MRYPGMALALASYDQILDDGRRAEAIYALTCFDITANCLSSD